MQNNTGQNILRRTRFSEPTLKSPKRDEVEPPAKPVKPENLTLSTNTSKTPNVSKTPKTQNEPKSILRQSHIYSKPISKHRQHNLPTKYPLQMVDVDKDDSDESNIYTQSDESITFDRHQQRERSRSPPRSHRRSLSPPRSHRRSLSPPRRTPPKERRSRSSSPHRQSPHSQSPRHQSSSPHSQSPHSQSRPHRSRSPPAPGHRTMRYMKYLFGRSRKPSPRRYSNSHRSRSPHRSYHDNDRRGSGHHSHHSSHHSSHHGSRHSSRRGSSHDHTVKGSENVGNKLDLLLKKIEHLEQQQNLEVGHDTVKVVPKQNNRGGLTDDPTILITKYNDYKPEKDKMYFQPPPDFEKDNKKDMAAAIPCYNEPSHEIQQTCNSLYDAFDCLTKYSPAWTKRNLKLIIIQDGWNFADPTTKKWFYDLFPATIGGVPWNEYFDEFKPGYKDPTSNATFMLERVGYLPSRMNTQKALDNDPKPMRITLLIKVNNRKKHNSHEWFLGKNGFAEATNAKYLFLTDAFTLYSKKCLYYLADHLDKNPDLIAVTGRQRLMTVEQQGSDEKFISFATILRWLQLFDFELSNAVYNGAFSWGGFTVVVPGPAGLYRAQDVLQDCIRDAYFDVVNSDPEATWTGWILANLRIAEDRVLTYYSVIKSPTAKFIAFNPLAVFYFEAETELKKLMYQRRRWINGSMAGYIYLVLICWKDLWNWKVPIYRRIYMFILLVIQMLIYFTMGLAPGISIRIMYYGIKYFVEVSGKTMGDYGDWRALLTFGAFMGLYLLHIILHHKKEKDPYYGGIMFFLVLMSFGTTVISFTAIGWYYFHDLAYAFTDIFTASNLILYFGLATIFGPFLVAALLGGKCHSPMYMTKSFLAYFLFMPLMIAWIGSYAYARTWDLSWGNRPNADVVETSQKNAKIAAFKSMSQKFMLALMVMNFAIFWLPLTAILWLMFGFFAATVYQMFFSIIYIFTKMPYKAKIHHHQRKTKKSFKRLSETASDEV